MSVIAWLVYVFGLLVFQLVIDNSLIVFFWACLLVWLFFNFMATNSIWVFLEHKCPRDFWRPIVLLMIVAYPHILSILINVFF
ncbi:hypothetical protein QG083_05680 [Kingella kingae]|uniref:hypothetical protein n=1 Tax=Kingella kingae TaxID=504 RepID=UPI000258459F|nr:hypothetical protein [Kingella kingae]EIC14139.1 hypothetical protein KKB_02600 [Kingella kingae PYKK081]MBD3614387.1 hypothetical protein [Kingella kingae]MBD3632621.1 hypothetical protein [Kingella kingae]MBD3660014.1 hypothetical protein [Kingella kingae]MDK4525854.1 hypothetical protein [Kingella kingae]